MVISLYFVIFFTVYDKGFIIIFHHQPFGRRILSMSCWFSFDWSEVERIIINGAIGKSKPNQINHHRKSAIWRTNMTMKTPELHEFFAEILLENNMIFPSFVSFFVGRETTKRVPCASGKRVPCMGPRF